MSKIESSAGKALYEQQETKLSQQSAAFIELLTKRGILGDSSIDDDRVRQAKKEKKKSMYHNTLLLLQHYRTILWTLECFPSSVAEELDRPLKDLDTLLDRIDLELGMNNRKLEGRMESVRRSRLLVDRLNDAVSILKSKPVNEDLFYMSVFITVSAKTYEELLWRKQQMVDMLKSMDMYTSECSFQQEAALQSVMPFLKISPKLEKKAQRNVLTSGAASSYIFTSFELSDDNGVLLGINRYNNSLCIVDLFNTKINKNANLNLLGTSGAGKTFTMQLLALRMRMRGIQCYILAPIKGHEFRRACNKIGGEFIKIAPGSPHCINVMEIRHTMSPEMELIDEIDYVEMGSMLARKIQQLMTFFGLLIPDMSNEEEQMLDEALIRTYADFGITHDNDSIYTDMSSVPPKMKQMPILGDLHKHLQENPMTQRLAAIISRFVTGSAQSFNRQTNVDLSNKYIVLDLSELKGKLLPVGMFIALDYVWDQIKSDRTKRKRDSGDQASTAGRWHHFGRKKRQRRLLT